MSSRRICLPPRRIVNTLNRLVAWAPSSPHKLCFDPDPHPYYHPDLKTVMEHNEKEVDSNVSFNAEPIGRTNTDRHELDNNNCSARRSEQSGMQNA